MHRHAHTHTHTHNPIIFIAKTLACSICVIMFGSLRDAGAYGRARVTFKIIGTFPVEFVVRKLNRVISIARYLDVDDCLISKVHNYLDDDHVCGNRKSGLLASRNAESPTYRT